MSDVSSADILSGMDDNLAAARNRAVGGLDEDPEEAARAVRLARATGTPSTAIYGDVDNFVAGEKAKATSYLVRNNPYIADYINSHPLASVISNDDYHALDDLSQSVQKFYSKSTLQKIHELINPIGKEREGMSKLAAIAYPDDPLAAFKEVAQNQYESDSYGLASTHPNLYKELRDARSILETGLTAVSTPIVGAQRLLSHYFGREAGAILEHEVTRGDILAGGTPKELIDAYKIAEPWLRKGDTGRLYVSPLPDVPTGLHPILDRFKKQQAQDDIKNLDEVISNVGKTETQQRSPEFTSNFIGLHGDREIGVSAEAIRKLYGDKQPTTDDGLFGWSPKFEERLASAEQFGTDVWFPAKDFAARMADVPEVWKEIRDFTRARDGGMTLDESKNLEDKTTIAEPLQSIRASGGLEPLAMAGDRKLTLEKMTPERTKEAFGDQSLEEFGVVPEDYDILDQSGNSIGFVSVSLKNDGKDLFIHNVQAGSEAAEFYEPRFLGPSLVRDLKRQLKIAYPNIERIGGFRVTGAREAAGAVDKMPIAWVKAMVDDDPQPFRDLLQAHWEVGGRQFDVLRGGEWTPAQAAIRDAVLAEAQRIVPTGVVEVAKGLRFSKVTGGRMTMGLFEPKTAKMFVSLENALGIRPGEGAAQQVGTLRHEAIHFLRRTGLITDAEWSTLRKAIDEQGWRDKYNINNRYRNFDEDIRDEESIAEAYRHWRQGEEVMKDTGVFQKIKDFMDSVLRRIKTSLGQELTWEELFKEIDVGRVGRREAQLTEGEAMLQARLEGGHEPLAMAEEKEPFGIYDRGRTLGITQAHMQRMLDLIAKRNADDFTASRRRAEVAQRRKISAEWKARRTQLRDDVRDAISQRPDISVDRLMAEGNYKLHPDFLTDEQKAQLPKDYVQKKNGVDPDDIASQFGYPSGDALVDHLAKLTEDRRKANMSPRDYFNRLVDIETDRRLNAEFGDRDSMIRDAALDQALSETQLNLTHQETLQYAIKAGVEPKLTASDVAAMVRVKVDAMGIKELDPYKLLSNANKLGKMANFAGTKNDWAEAYRLAQVQQQNVIAAKFAKDYLKQRQTLDRLFKTYAKIPTKETAQKIDQAYYNYVQETMVRVGQKIQRIKENLDDALEKEPYDSLGDFVRTKERALRDLYLPDYLRDGLPPKPIDEMNYREFKDLHDFVKRMDFNARDERTITRQGEKADLNQTIDDIIDRLPGSLPPRTIRIDRPEKTVRETVKSNWWSLITTRSLAKRLDRGDPKGLLTTLFADPATAADANESAMWKAQVAKLKDEIGKIPDMDKLVTNNVFRDPNTGEYIPMRKRNALAVLSYWGERTNRIKLIKGWDVKPEEVEAFLKASTKPEDWDRAQKFGDMFDELFNRASNMARDVSGVGVEKLPLQQFTDVHGTLRRGWYNPAKYESLLPGKSDVLLGKTAVDTDNYFRASTPQGWGKARTGYIAPFDLTLDAIPIRMKQMIHDIAWRGAILDMGKIIYNSKFQRAIISRYGRHQMEEFKTYVEDMANSNNVDSVAEHYREGAFEFFRRNTVQALIGLNPSTVAKHGLTAGLNSLTQVGPLKFMREFLGVFRRGGAYPGTQLKMAYDKSEVIQNRMQNIEQIIRGRDPTFTFEPGKFSQFREIMMHLGSFPVALGDFMSTVPTWLAAYKDKIAAGETEGFARSYADRAVIEAHGSALRSNQPSIMRRSNALGRTFSSLYGFFSHMLQKQYEFAWKAKDIWNGEKPLDIQGQWATPMLNNLWSYWIAPAIVEEMITPYTNKERESWGAKAAKMSLIGLSSSLLYVRDFVRALFFGGDTGAGLMGTMAKSGADLYKDLTKHQPLSRENMGKVVKDAVTSVAILTGLTNAQQGKTAEYVYRYAHGLERPKGPWDVAVGARYGTTKNHSHTFKEWWNHMLR